MLELSTGCRLHFGLLELAEGQLNRYGGLGLMLESPCLRLRWQPAPGPQQPIVAANVEIARRVQLAQMHAYSAMRHEFPEISPEPSGVIEVLECPPLHSGLGVGTQLATSVAQLTALAVNHCVAPDALVVPGSAEELAALSGRGKRSAIGLHGFQHGGLVRDLGYQVSDHPSSTQTSHSEPVARPVHAQHVYLPRDWMVVLCCACASGDVHGQVEDQLINRAAARPNRQRERMLALSAHALAAGESDDFVGFTAVLDEYMDLASQLFAHVQGGRYRDSRTAWRVEQLRGAGLKGVGQSSWGPTIFGFASDMSAAQAAANHLAHVLDSDNVRVVITRPKSTGAQWSMTSAGGMQYAS